jgi:hypothetical protein
MELPYIIINGHGETLPSPLVIPPALFFKHKKGRTPKHNRMKHYDEHFNEIMYPPKPPPQEVDSGFKTKCAKQKKHGTIKLNKREKYYAKYGFTKKRVNLDF